MHNIVQRPLFRYTRNLIDKRLTWYVGINTGKWYSIVGQISIHLALGFVDAQRFFTVTSKMNREEVQKYLRLLGEGLQQQQIMGEILVNDGVIVMLDIGRPEEQVDIDAYMAYLKGEGPEIKRKQALRHILRGMVQSYAKR